MSTRLINNATGAEEVVDDGDVASLLASKKYIAPGPVAVRSNGSDTYAAPDQAVQANAYNPIVDPTTSALAAGHKIREDANSGAVNTVKAGVGSALNMGSFGLVNPWQEQQEFHGTAATIGGVAMLGGQLLLGNDLGVSRLLGESAGATDGARALAASSDALTAEHVSSGISSTSLLGGESATKAERGLGRAGSALDDASTAKAAIEGAPKDIAGLDAKGLREAAVTERESLKAAADAERASLEEARVPMRKQLADDIKELHATLADEAPISKAVQGADVAKIEGIKDARVQLAKSYGAMRSALDSPLSVARDPSSLIRPLEMRQVALEQIQAKTPELMETLGADARGAALRHVDDALAATKEQIARIRDLSPKNPVTSAKLTDLASGTSPRLRAIEAAQDALKNAPEKGWLQKTAEGGAFGGGTALAHMIPGVGIAAPFVGKYASEAVGRLFSRLAEHGAESAAKTASSARAFLDVGGKSLKAARFVPSKALAAVRFAASSDESTGKETMADLFKARSAEVRSQTQYAPDGSVQMRPEARAAMAKRLDPIATVNPLLADKLETLGARKIAFISSKIPRKPDIGGMQIGPDKWQPSDMQMASWARTIHAVENPDEVEKHLAAGYLTPEEGEAYRTVYPERFAAFQQQLIQGAATLSKTIPYARRLAWSAFAGVPIDPSMEPNIQAVLQGTFSQPAPNTADDIPGMQPPKLQPSYGSLGSIKKSIDSPTPAQARATGGRA